MIKFLQYWQLWGTDPTFSEEVLVSLKYQGIVQAF